AGAGAGWRGAGRPEVPESARTDATMPAAASGGGTRAPRRIVRPLWGRTAWPPAMPVLYPILSRRRASQIRPCDLNSSATSTAPFAAPIFALLLTSVNLTPFDRAASLRTRLLEATM